MTNAEMKTVLTKAGVNEADIAKLQAQYDFDKISQTVEMAHSPREAMEAVHELYPELEVVKIQEQMDFIQGQFEAAFNGEKTELPIELNEEELEMVSGGGFKSWWGSHWKGVVGAAIGATIGATAGGMITGMLSFGPASIPLVVVASIGMGIAAGVYGYQIGHSGDR